MNRILITARKARGLTEKEVAKELKIGETLYKKIEAGISAITHQMAQTLEQLYNVPDYYFAIPCFYKGQNIFSFFDLEKNLFPTSGS